MHSHRRPAGGPRANNHSNNNNNKIIIITRLQYCETVLEKFQIALLQKSGGDSHHRHVQSCTHKYALGAPTVLVYFLFSSKQFQIAFVMFETRVTGKEKYYTNNLSIS